MTITVQITRNDANIGYWLTLLPV